MILIPHLCARMCAPGRLSMLSVLQLVLWSSLVSGSTRVPQQLKSCTQPSTCFVNTASSLRDGKTSRGTGPLHQGRSAMPSEPPQAASRAGASRGLRTVMHSGRMRKQQGPHAGGYDGDYFIDVAIQAKSLSYFEETWGPILKSRDGGHVRSAHTKTAPAQIPAGLDEIEEPPSDREDQGRRPTYTIVENIKPRRPVVEPRVREVEKVRVSGGVEPVPAEYESFAHAIADNIQTNLKQHFRRSRTEEQVRQMVAEIEKEVSGLIWRCMAGEAIFGTAAVAHAEAGYVWAVNVLADAEQFRAGAPTFTFSVALLQRGRAVLGLLGAPMTGERWVGSRGAQTTLNGQLVTAPPPSAANKPAAQAPASLLGSLGAVEQLGGLERAGAEQLRRGAGSEWVEMGSEAYGCALVAGGLGDAALATRLPPPTLYALAPIVQGAGGHMCDWHGRPVTGGPGPGSDGRVLVASSARLARDLLERMTV